MQKKILKILWVFLLTAAPCFLLAAGNPDGDKTPVTSITISSPEDTSFIELHLSPEGVYAVDSSKGEWEYDVSRNRFEKTEKSTRGTSTVFRRGSRGAAEEFLSTEDSLEQVLMSIEDSLEAAGEHITSVYRRIRGLQLGSVVIDEDEQVDGPVIAVGPITVKGQVDGDVISYSKIMVTATGIITGDARAPEIVKMRGGKIGGRRLETEMPRMPDIEIFQETSEVALIVVTTILCVLLFTALLAAAVVPTPLNRLRDCLQTKFPKAFLIGFAVWILFIPVFALLCLTIIGIPVAILALPLALIGAIIMGSLGFGYLAGHNLNRLLGDRFPGRLLQLIIGMIMLFSPWLLMAVFRVSASPVSQGFSTFFLVLAIVIWSIGLTAGVGSVVLTRFGSRDCSAVRRPHFGPGVYPPPSPPPPTPPPLKSDH